MATYELNQIREQLASLTQSVEDVKQLLVQVLQSAPGAQAPADAPDPAPAAPETPKTPEAAPETRSETAGNTETVGQQRIGAPE